MAPGHGDVVNPHSTFVPPSHLKYELGVHSLLLRFYQVDYSHRIFFEHQGFDQKVRLVCAFLRNVVVNLVNQPVLSPTAFKRVGEGSLADLALEALPREGHDVSLLCINLFPDCLLLNPLLQALEVDKADGSVALARIQKRIFGCGVGRPAYLALLLCS